MTWLARSSLRFPRVWLIGGILVIALYLWLFFRAGMIIRRSKSTYGAFLAFGLSMGLVLQAFVNMAVAVGLVPVTGQTLPLVSMGGSSIFFTSMATGMILSVSWGTREVPGEEEKPLAEAEAVSASGDLAPAAERVADQAPAPLKEKGNKRTEFDVNG